jgi:hypothetical protein
MSDIPTIVPHPGSAEAVNLGCRCAVYDNHHGRGCGFTNEDGSPAFYVTEGCPLHWPLTGKPPNLERKDPDAKTP